MLGERQAPVRRKHVARGEVVGRSGGAVMMGRRHTGAGRWQELAHRASSALFHGAWAFLQVAQEPSRTLQ